MKNFINSMDNLPWLVKILLCLPVLDLIWGIYRLIKGIDEKSVLKIIFGIVWIITGFAILWIIDIVCTIIFKRPTLLA
ncbi:MAG: hypothetical protein IJX17_07650 [Clostridia bacterium]|nr:hypothetical protein [Clostridia bacterium]